MGFGLLFIGYFIAFLMSVNTYGFAFEIVGYAVIFSAVGKLAEYKHKLSGAALPLFLTALCSLFEGGRLLSDLLMAKSPFFSESTALWFSLASTIFSVAFQTILLLGIREIAKDAESDGLPARAVWCTAMVWAVGVLELILTASNGTTFAESNLFRILTLSVTLASILYPIAVLAFLYSCYAGICAPEDMDMAPRPSRFAFINRMREERDRRVAEAERFREEALRNAEQERKSSKNKTSKKK